MNYQRIYDTLIERAKHRVETDGEYYERHHILPRSKGGLDDATNIATLTGREHFLAHWLLWKINRDQQTAAAFWWMCQQSKHHTRKRMTSRQFAIARKAASESKRGNRNPMFGLGDSHPNKKRTGQNNPNYGIPPWENSNVKNNTKLRWLWDQREEYLTTWRAMGQPHWYKFGTHIISTHPPHMFTPHNFRNMVNWFANQEPHI